MIVTLFAAWLLAWSLTGFVGFGPGALPGRLIVLWWVSSFLAQMLAGPMILVAAATAVLASAWVAKGAAGFAAVTFLLIHLRNRRDGERMLRAVGLDDRLPLSAGLWPISSRSGVKRISRIAYAEDGERTTLDLVVPAERPARPAPVLLHIHGGAWVLGKRDQQAKPLLHHLARNGWVCVDINYRLGPKNRFPAMLTDVLRAIAWTKANIAEHGGDPDRIALTGGSAGGHLTSLGALCGDRVEAKPGFEGADCSVRAAVPCYGRFDFIDRLGLWGRNRDQMRKFNADNVLPVTADEALWDLASPIAQIRPAAPPMLVIHGRHDTLIPYQEGAAFVAALRDAGAHADHIELAGGQHAFDTMQSALTWGHVRAVRHWLEQRV